MVAILTKVTKMLIRQLKCKDFKTQSAFGSSSMMSDKLR